LAVQEGKLYADSFADLLTFDLAIPLHQGCSRAMKMYLKPYFKGLHQQYAGRGSYGYRDSLVSYAYKNKYSPYEKKY
jgi:hypothetical protein